jgi:hypothetical protein
MTEANSIGSSHLPGIGWRCDAEVRQKPEGRWRCGVTATGVVTPEVVTGFASFPLSFIHDPAETKRPISIQRHRNRTDVSFFSSTVDSAY